ncbi:Hypothetical predicted protein [Pelobates cultripes]|uniref:Uncharacterized protein n=1 Tax=Pelobates cultripes TaxID=61616 RepID=A0AAD1WLW6_PELCU|nr:Hypothetical predicted protein [Pelobates cultripes]
MQSALPCVLDPSQYIIDEYQTGMSLRLSATIDTTPTAFSYPHNNLTQTPHNNHSLSIDTHTQSLPLHCKQQPHFRQLTQPGTGADKRLTLAILLTTDAYSKKWVIGPARGQDKQAHRITKNTDIYTDRNDPTKIKHHCLLNPSPLVRVNFCITHNGP